MLTLVLILIALWIVSGVLAYGMTFYYFQERFKLIAAERRESDIYFALLVGASGPSGFVVAMLLFSGFRGLRFW